MPSGSWKLTNIAKFHWEVDEILQLPPPIHPPDPPRGQLPTSTCPLLAGEPDNEDYYSMMSSIGLLLMEKDLDTRSNESIIDMLKVASNGDTFLTQLTSVLNQITCDEFPDADVNDVLRMRDVCEHYVLENRARASTPVSGLVAEVLAAAKEPALAVAEPAPANASVPPCAPVGIRSHTRHEYFVRYQRLPSAMRI